MNIVIRVDASAKIGTGHVMRCLTLADELNRDGADISFICREEVGNLIELIKSKGYKAYHLPPGINSRVDKELTQRVLQSQPQRPDWLVVDHYGLDAHWESSVRPSVRKVMVIDDMANRPHDCDLLLNQNYGFLEGQYCRLVPAQCTQLLGPGYALLRPQFLKARENLQRKWNGRASRFLVFMGGADPSNETCKVLRAMQMVKRADLSIDVVIGTSNAHRAEIETLASQIPNTTCHYHLEDMAGLMASADLGIGAAGTATWERCCVGLPSLVITIAVNQIDIAENLSGDGIVINLGWYEKVTETDIKNAVEGLVNDPHRVMELSQRSKDLVDGRGAERVAEELYRQGAKA